MPGRDVIDGGLFGRSTHSYRTLQKSSRVHVLIVPRLHVASIDHLGLEHRELWWHGLVSARRLARELGIDVDQEGYHLVANAGRHSARQFPHLHVHLASGGLL
ncbi:MAG TPA: HIT domain-containing protein [Candidatus Dormibacteraeota bacterium]|nr:HIT domain-containing protein [Candidatus Dormibacteraeota bacterium]